MLPIHDIHLRLWQSDRERKFERIAQARALRDGVASGDEVERPFAMPTAGGQVLASGGGLGQA